MFMPNTFALPSDGSINPVNIDSVVVFPAPLWPSSANICPLYRVKSNPFTAILSPKFFLSYLIIRHSFCVSYYFKDS